MRSVEQLGIVPGRILVDARAPWLHDAADQDRESDHARGYRDQRGQWPVEIERRRKCANHSGGEVRATEVRPDRGRGVPDAVVTSPQGQDVGDTPDNEV